MSKLIFSRRAPDNITEELVAVLSSKASFEFNGRVDVSVLNLRQRNAASGGEEMLRLRTYEKLQSLVSQGAVTRTVTGVIKKYKGVGSRMVKVSAEMKLLRAEWNARLRAKAAGAAWFFLCLYWTFDIVRGPESASDLLLSWLAQ